MNAVEQRKQTSSTPAGPALAPTLWRQDLTVLIVSLLAILAWDASGLDLPLARLAGSANGFALREHWLTSTVLHEGTRMLAWGLVLLLIVQIWRPLPGPAGLPALTRKDRTRWLGMTVAAAAVVPLIKRFSLTSCPWDLVEFGGLAQYVSHWAWRVADGGGGHCFPSGHATTAFALFSGGFVLRRSYPVLARRWQLTILFIGLMLGVVQMLRGAHYLSHTLWSGWICFAVCALCAGLGVRGGKPTP